MAQALITGGAGFIGTNATLLLREHGFDVAILDNLSRYGAVDNLTRMVRSDGNISVFEVDIRDREAVGQVVTDCAPDLVIHLAGQTAVTTSLDYPLQDFDINARGAINLLEACRQLPKQPFLINASTNKVYGSLQHLTLVERKSSYQRISGENPGLDETTPLSFSSPYGCSKGYADQAFLDFAKSFDLPGVSLRQSCIYGRNQYGVEDQGWVAWMALAALADRRITVFGNGKQVRDLLYVDDLVQAYLRLYESKEDAAGQAFNVGGGISNAVSVIDYLNFLEQHLDVKIKTGFADARVGDQKYYVSDNSRLSGLVNWYPEVSMQDGIPLMVKWIKDHRLLE